MSEPQADRRGIYEATGWSNRTHAGGRARCSGSDVRQGSIRPVESLSRWRELGQASRGKIVRKCDWRGCGSQRQRLGFRAMRRGHVRRIETDAHSAIRRVREAVEELRGGDVRVSSWFSRGQGREYLGDRRPREERERLPGVQVQSGGKGPPDAG